MSRETADTDNELTGDNSAEKGRRTGSVHDTAPRKERALLMGVSRPPSQYPFETDEHLEELELLTETAGAEVVEKHYQNRSAIVSATFIGRGKAEMLAERCEEADIQTVIFDDDLSPMQQRNLEKIINRKVIDRTALILDIFAAHARSNTARTQVELAQLEYLLPRLSGMWTHFSKQVGGIGTKGPGETQIETDRRILRDRISHLKIRLAKIHRQRETQRKGRDQTTRIALVGYTNVGKSTLLNALTGSDALVEDMLFATLDSTVRALEIENQRVLLTDTVGFIRKLPSHLVASFKSTLDEVVEADILLHVVDITHPGFLEQIQIVQNTLKDLKADGKPVITVFNKIDGVPRFSPPQGLQDKYPDSVFISAARGINLSQLLAKIQHILEDEVDERTFVIQPPDFRISSEFHRSSKVRSETVEDSSIRLTCVIHPATAESILKRYPGAVSIEGEESDDEMRA